MDPKGLEAVQRASFPTLVEAEIITAAHYAAHIRRFPEGQLAVVTDSDRVVACSTDFRTTVDFDAIEHRYVDAVAHNWLSNHDPAGEWLYGADIGVLPEYRRRGIATMLYEARRDLLRRLNLRGTRGRRDADRLRTILGSDAGGGVCRAGGRRDDHRPDSHRPANPLYARTHVK